MKRDMDLIRAILVKAEAAGPDESVSSIEGWDRDDFAYHVWLMREAGLVLASVMSADIYAGAMLGLMGGVYLASEFAGQVATKVFVDLFLGFITGAVALESAFHLLRFAKPRPAQ